MNLHEIPWFSELSQTPSSQLPDNTYLSQKLLSCLNTTTLPSDEEIQKRYISAPHESIELLCSYTTRLHGFLDILLSWKILSSSQVFRLIWTVNTHRGDGMWRWDKSRFRLNDYISFSTGFVSYKYSDREIRTRDAYVGGYWFLLPLNTLLAYPRLRFSHASRKGGIQNYNLTRENILPAVQTTREKWELYDDGFGNLFEVLCTPSYTPEATGNLPPNVLDYPEIQIDKGVIAIPASEKDEIYNLLLEKQKVYRHKLPYFNAHKPWKGLYIHGNRTYHSYEEVEQAKAYIVQLLQPIDLDKHPIYRYEHQNLDLALKYLSIK